MTVGVVVLFHPNGIDHMTPTCRTGTLARRERALHCQKIGGTRMTSAVSAGRHG
jgi:hypothetical protein